MSEALLNRLTAGRAESGRAQTILPLKRVATMIEEVLKALGLTREEFISPDDFTKPQAVARAARRAGFEALIASSAIGDDCETLVVFKDRLEPPSYLELSLRVLRQISKLSMGLAPKL
jgi:hypothetical protein